MKASRDQFAFGPITPGWGVWVVGQILFAPDSARVLFKKIGDLDLKGPGKAIQGRDRRNVTARLKPLIPTGAKAKVFHVFLSEVPPLPELPYIFRDSPDQFPCLLVNFLPFSHYFIVILRPLKGHDR